MEKFNGHKVTLKSNISLSLNLKLYNQCYESGTCVTNQSLRTITGSCSKNDGKSNNWCVLTRLSDKWVGQRQNQSLQHHCITTTGKWIWASHITCIADNRWTNQVANRRSMYDSQFRGRPLKRKGATINAFWKSVTWKWNAKDKLWWKSNAEAFILQVDLHV